MIIWGWGKKTKEFTIDQMRRIVVVYSYFHIMFAFTVAWGPKYILAQWTEQGWATSEIAKDEATILNQGVKPDIHWWWKWSLPLVPAAFAVVGLFVALFSL